MWHHLDVFFMLLYLLSSNFRHTSRWKFHPVSSSEKNMKIGLAKLLQKFNTTLFKTQCIMPVTAQTVQNENRKSGSLNILNKH